MANSNAIGKKFEKQFEPMMKRIANKEKWFFHRFPDSYSSGGLIPAQPGDYMLTMPGAAVLIELKASEKHDSLVNCLSSAVSEAQCGFHRRWELSGHGSMFLFQSMAKAEIEVWDGSCVIKHRVKGERLSEAPMKCFKRENMESELRGIFNTYY